MEFENLRTKGDFIAYVLKNSEYKDIDTAIPYGVKQNDNGTLVTVYVTSMLDSVVTDIVAEAQFLHLEKLKEAVL